MKYEEGDEVYVLSRDDGSAMKQSRGIVTGKFYTPAPGIPHGRVCYHVKLDSGEDVSSPLFGIHRGKNICLIRKRPADL